MGNLISIVSHLKNRYDAPTMVHICGDTGPMLADFAKVGAAAFSLDHAVDMRAAKEALGGRSAIVGNIDPVSVIMSGTAEDVRRESQRCFDEAGAGGGFIIGPGCAVPYGTPIENIRAMVEEDRYCGDVLTQLAAVESAVKAISREVMRDHLETCVVERIQAGDTEVTDEVMDLFRKFM